MPLTVGTAGHIDHGKTWLVKALTGKDTDRLPEEQARGISIDLGYAPLELPDGRRLSLIDVPGHERFVRTMVAGASGIDLFLLVIDAGEGARPQTHEHLAILRLLGIEHGVVAVTKADAVDAETLELALEGRGEERGVADHAEGKPERRDLFEHGRHAVDEPQIEGLLPELPLDLLEGSAVAKTEGIPDDPQELALGELDCRRILAVVHGGDDATAEVHDAVERDPPGVVAEGKRGGVAALGLEAQVLDEGAPQVEEESLGCLHGIPSVAGL